MRSAADQYAYGEKAYWAWDWNLALPHLLLGVDWDGIFGFRFDQQEPPIVKEVQALEVQRDRHTASGHRTYRAISFPNSMPMALSGRRACTRR